MENFTSADQALIIKECRHKSAADIAFLIDQTVDDVKAFMKAYAADAGIITYQQLLDEKVKVAKPRAPRPAKAKAAKAQKVKVKKPVVISRVIEKGVKETPAFKTTRSGEKIWKTREVDYSKMHLVRIDDKTQVYAKPGESEDECRRRYHNMRLRVDHHLPGKKETHFKNAMQ